MWLIDSMVCYFVGWFICCLVSWFICWFDCLIGSLVGRLADSMFCYFVSVFLFRSLLVYLLICWWLGDWLIQCFCSRMNGMSEAASSSTTSWGNRLRFKLILVCFIRPTSSRHVWSIHLPSNVRLYLCRPQQSTICKWLLGVHHLLNTSTQQQIAWAVIPGT